MKTVCKELLVSKKNKEKVDLEINLHERLSIDGHKNIIKFIRSFEIPNFVLMVLELAELKTLKEVSIRRVTITEAEARYYFTQIAAGLKFLSDNRILHRDIKLGNLFLSSEMTVKIGDFGLAIPFSDQRRLSRCGTPNYISPEVLEGRGHSLQSDLWSVGCVLYALLCGKPPFDSRSRDTTYMLIRNHLYTIPPELSFQAAQFLRQLLDVEPLDRGNLNPPGSPQSLLSHPFLCVGLTPARLPPSAVFKEPDWDWVMRESSLGPVIPQTQHLDTFLEGVDQQLQLFLNRKVGEGEDLVDKRKVPVFVSRWVDYSDRFGFVFQLSDGGLGVLYSLS